MSRARAAALALPGALLVLATAFPGATATAATPTSGQTSSCNGVMQGGASGTLTKTVTGVNDNKDGTWTVSWTGTTNRPDGTYRVRDCAFVDADGNGAQNSGEKSYGTDVMSYAVSGGAVSGTIVVAGSSGQSVCDRVALSGTDPSTLATFTDKSNVACTTLGTTPVPLGSVGLLGVVALASVAFAVATARQRSHAAAVPR